MGHELRHRTVYVYDTASKKIVGKVRTGNGPAWLTFSPDGKYCCVSNVLSDDVSVIDAAKRQEVARIKVGNMPKRLVASGAIRSEQHRSTIGA